MDRRLSTLLRRFWVASAAWLLAGMASAVSAEVRTADWQTEPRPLAWLAPNDSAAQPLAGPASGLTLATAQQAEAAQPPHSPFFAVVVTGARSERVEGIARQADQCTRHGCELAGRKAYFAARAEFVAALRLVSGALDAENGAVRYSQSLAAGLSALSEAGDFLPKGSRIEADLDLGAIVGSHRTPVLKGANLTQLTPQGCLQAYFTFAQEQLAASVGTEVAGSMALCNLGKLHMTMVADKTSAPLAAEPKAVVFLQASLLAWPHNTLAANELGVLLARAGDLAAARNLLEYSLAIEPRAVVLRNLTVIYHQQGEHELAGRAQWAAGGPGGTTSEAGRMVDWVDPRVLGAGVLAPQVPVTAQQPAPFMPQYPRRN